MLPRKLPPLPTTAHLRKRALSPPSPTPLVLVGAADAGMAEDVVAAAVPEHL